MTTFLPVTSLTRQELDGLLLLTQELEQGNPVAGRALGIAVAFLKGHRPVGTPQETGRLLGVDRATVGRWNKQGKLAAAFRTPGGTRRYYLDEVLKLRDGQHTEPEEPAL